MSAGPHRRRGPPHPAGQVRGRASSSAPFTDPARARRRRFGGHRPRPPRRAAVARAAEGRPTTRCRWIRRRRSSSSPGAAPTTSACRAAAGRSRARAAPGPITPGTTILEGITGDVVDPSQRRATPARRRVRRCRRPATPTWPIVVLAEDAVLRGRRRPRRPRACPPPTSSSWPGCGRSPTASSSSCCPGRPLVVTDEIGDWDAFVAAWLPGSEGAGRRRRAVRRTSPFTGRLPYTWPRSNAQLPLDPDAAVADVCAGPLFPRGYAQDGDELSRRPRLPLSIRWSAWLAGPVRADCARWTSGATPWRVPWARHGPAGARRSSPVGLACCSSCQVGLLWHPAALAHVRVRRSALPAPRSERHPAASSGSTSDYFQHVAPLHRMWSERPTARRLVQLPVRPRGGRAGDRNRHRPLQARARRALRRATGAPLADRRCWRSTCCGSDRCNGGRAASRSVPTFVCRHGAPDRLRPVARGPTHGVATPSGARRMAGGLMFSELIVATLIALVLLPRARARRPAPLRRRSSGCCGTSRAALLAFGAPPRPSWRGTWWGSEPAQPGQPLQRCGARRARRHARGCTR